MHEPTGLNQMHPVDDTAMALDVVCAEIVHELMHTVSYLQCQDDDATGAAPKWLQYNRGEIERLTRLLGHLKRFQLPSPLLETLPLGEVLTAAAQTVTPIRQQKSLSLAVDVPTELTVQAERTRLSLLCCYLLENSALAAPLSGSHGVRVLSEPPAPAGSLRIEFWNSGSELPCAVGASLYSPWTASSWGRLGLGLSVAYRIARSFGWDLTLQRQQDLTSFIVTITAAHSDG